jgi:hypothetical protein
MKVIMCEKFNNLTIFAGILLLSISLIFTACSDSGQTSADLESSFDFKSLSEKLKALTPQGWNLYEKVDFFTADNLYERINGRAELYLAYNVIGMAAATFEKGGSSGDFIELSIFDMGSATNSFGIFSVERSAEEAALGLGRKSYLSGSNAYIWKGIYYITIVVSDINDELTQMTKDVALKTANILPDSGEPVWGLSAFPQDNLFPESIKYFKVDALGLDFMQETYTAIYRNGNREVTTFLSRKASSEDAQKTVARYVEYGKRYGSVIKHLTKNNLDLYLCDMKGKYDVIFRKDRLACGIVSSEDPDSALELASELGKQLFLD